MLELSTEDLDQLPPPTYQISQDEFDRKTGQAEEASLQLTEEHIGSHDGGEVWEEWNDAIFETNSRRMVGVDTPSASSSSYVAVAPPQTYPEKPPIIEMSAAPAVPPLSIVKRNRMLPQPRPTIPANNSYPYRLTERPASPPTSPPPVPWSNTPSRSLSIMSSSRTPPPSFEAVGPSLDGPPYEEISQIYLDSRQPSPLSHHSGIPDLPPTPRTQPRSTSHMNSTPPHSHPRQTTYNRQHRSPDQYTSSSSYWPIIPNNFDPLSAYPRRSVAPEVAPGRVNASEFYAAPVAHVMLSTTNKRPAPRPNQLYQQDRALMSQNHIHSSVYSPSLYSEDRSSIFSDTSDSYYSQEDRRLSADQSESRWHRPVGRQPPLRPNH